LKTDATDSARREAFGSRAQQRTILLAEDTAMLRHLYSHFLLNAGYRVLQAHDGAVAKKLAQSNGSIDLLLTDYHMPGLNGVELAQWFRGQFPNTPVLLLSATLEHVEFASEAVPFAICRIKPAQPDILTELVECALTGRTPPPLVE
jgi:DNA-binding response OmpR family regulator